jgi:hypothetical protein
VLAFAGKLWSAAQDGQRLCEIRASAARAAYPNYFDAAMIISAPWTSVAMSENHEGKRSLQARRASALPHAGAWDYGS